MVLVKRWLRKCGGPEGTRDNGETKKRKERSLGKRKRKKLKHSCAGRRCRVTQQVDVIKPTGPERELGQLGSPRYKGQLANVTNATKYRQIHRLPGQTSTAKGRREKRREEEKR
jgi:hypothetical protein